MVKAVLLFVCAAATTVACSGWTRPVGVVLVTLDTTRADRLTAYGFKNAEMPHLDRLAREGVVFEQASSVAPLTLPAHASLFTGLVPPSHRVRDNVAPPLSSGNTTLAEVLRSAGFRTAAFVGSSVLDRERGLSQGFERYSGVPRTHRPGQSTAQRTGEQVVDEAIHWIGSIGDERFFLWAHLYDPHRPYEPPEPFASRHAGDPYVGEIAYADAQIGRLLGALEREGRLNESIVVVAGDHGESLGEHGERDHGIFVYQSVLRVPLIIRAPSLEPRRVASVVRLIDLMPTILDLLALPEHASDGVSLTPLMNERLQHLDAYAESIYPQRFGASPLRSLRDGRFKLIDTPRPELYDLEHDPFEQHNVYSERPTTAAALHRRLAALGGGHEWADGASIAVPVAPRDVRERLAALGYVSNTTRNPPGRKTRPDAKDFVERIQKEICDARRAAISASRGFIADRDCM